MLISHAPGPRLRPFASLIWASAPTGVAAGPPTRELVLPTGAAHHVVRLGGDPVRVFAGSDDAIGRTIGRSVVGGPRASPYEKLIGNAGAAVGVLLRPGAGQLLLGAPGRELAHRHTSLEDVWPAAEAAELRERLEEVCDVSARLQVMEMFLERHLLGATGVDPLVAYLRTQLDGGAAVGRVVASIGLSHRHVSTAFAHAVGVAPKLYQRLQRFNRALDRLHREPCTPLAGLAARLGYADQAHLSRDFREFAGLSPGDYRRSAPANARHVPVKS